jgi:2,4-diketo-3-deoxy-L-fuconate hydrolase
LNAPRPVLLIIHRPDPGDATGTPPDVALGMKPRKFLKAGDVVRLRMDGLGEQTQKVVGFRR